jgi:hypothetical protein
MSPTSTSLKLMQSKRRNSVWYRPVSCNRNFSSQEAFVSSPYINETTCVPNDLYMALRPMLAVTQVASSPARPHSASADGVVGSVAGRGGSDRVKAGAARRCLVQASSIRCRRIALASGREDHFHTKALAHNLPSRHTEVKVEAGGGSDLTRSA